jgi:hypothetical protein
VFLCNSDSYPLNEKRVNGLITKKIYFSFYGLVLM